MSELKAEAAKAVKNTNEIIWDAIATIGGAVGVSVVAAMLLPSTAPFAGYLPGVAGGIAGAIIWRRARRDN